LLIQIDGFVGRNEAFWEESFDKEKEGCTYDGFLAWKEELGFSAFPCSMTTTSMRARIKPLAVNPQITTCMFAGCATVPCVKGPYLGPPKQCCYPSEDGDQEDNKQCGCGHELRGSGFVPDETNCACVPADCPDDKNQNDGCEGSGSGGGCAKPEFSRNALGDVTEMVSALNERLRPKIPGALVGPGTLDVARGFLMLRLSLPGGGNADAPLALTYNSRFASEEIRVWPRLELFFASHH